MLSHTFVDTVTVWQKVGVNEFGNPTFSAPVTFKARWEDIEDYLISVEKKDRIAKAAIYWDGTPLLSVGDYLYNGSSTELAPISGSDEVLNIRRTKSLSGKRVEYAATI